MAKKNFNKIKWNGTNTYKHSEKKLKSFQNVIWIYPSINVLKHESFAIHMK